MSKMTVIQLLNKIANGEEVKAKHNLFDLEYYNKNEMQIGYGKGINMFTLMDLIRILNEEVEIIEEDRKIRKIKVDYSPDIEEKIFYEDEDKPNHCILGDAGTKLLINKINEIIDYINGGTNENTRN